MNILIKNIVRLSRFVNTFLYLAEAKSAKAVLPNAAAGASAPMLLFERDISMSLSNFASVQHRVILIVKRPLADEFTGKITLRSKPGGLLTGRIENLQYTIIPHKECLLLQICVTLW